MTRLNIFWPRAVSSGTSSFFFSTSPKSLIML
jgi:hypothetical protein